MVCCAILEAISDLIAGSCDQEQALYVLLAATGMRISEALGVETRHFINEGRTIQVEQQVEKDSPRIVRYLKTVIAKRGVDLRPKVAEFLQRYMTGEWTAVQHGDKDAAHVQQSGRSLTHASARQNGTGREGNGLAFI
jgi:integrase